MKDFIKIAVAVFIGLMLFQAVWVFGVNYYLDAKYDPEIERLEKAAQEANDAHNIFH